MAIYGGAQWRPISVNYNSGGNSPRLLIVHIMQGTLAGTDSWFRNPSAQVSAHFGVGKDGTIYQWVNTKDTAWHAADANNHSIGVECEGYSGQTLTTAQRNSVAVIYAWAHKQHGAISMWLNTNPTSGSGLSWHGLGGVAWGNHPDCPGTPIVDQLPLVLSKAQDILNPPPPEEDEDMNGHLKTGTSAETAIAFAVGKYSAINFLNDYTRTGSEPPKLRIAVWDTDKLSWHVVRVTLVNGKTTGVGFPSRTNGISIVRDGQGDDVEVGYNLS